MKIFDLHNDLLSVAGAKKTNRYISRESSKGLCGLNCAVFSTGKSEKQIFDMVDQFYHEKHNQEAICSSVDLFLSFEDLEFVTPRNLDKIILASPKMCSLTWNEDNNLAGGAFGASGLLPIGRKVVEVLESYNILIDTAHLNERSFVDVARIATKPLVCTHTAMHFVCNHNRNLKDYEIRIILESGGLVGLCFVSNFISPARHASVEDVARHVLHFANTFGCVDGLAIGSDFFGTKHLPIGLCGYKDFENLSCVLLRMGFCEIDIENLFFGNAAKLVHSI